MARLNLRFGNFILQDVLGKSVILGQKLQF